MLIAATLGRKPSLEAGPALGPETPTLPCGKCAWRVDAASGGCLLPGPAVFAWRRRSLAGGDRIATPQTTNEPRINDRIRAREVRLVDADGTQLGIKPLPEALHIARQADMDLVEVAPQAAPPVCRIMDYGKFKFDTAQRAKESRRKTTNVSVKEMKYRPKIGPGDFETKTRQVSRFLSEGHKVKITIMFRGREMSHPELGKKILDRVADQVVDMGKVEVTPKLDGRNMIMVLAPDRRAQQARTKAEHDGSEPPAEAGSAEVADSASAGATGTNGKPEAPSPAAEGGVAAAAPTEES
ncbi:MAG TPA: translation initiation factor IF-3 [Acidimicrobiales bacterium]|nr:translation initiation factor IF-3 [Acidimicrobiales bacterium]